MTQPIPSWCINGPTYTPSAPSPASQEAGLNQLNSQDPNFIFPMIQRAEFYLTTGQVLKALDDFKFVLAHVAHENAKERAREGVARCTQSLQANPPSQEERLNHVIEHCPNYTPARLERAELYFRNGQIERALQDYSSILAQGPHREAMQGVARCKYALQGGQSIYASWNERKAASAVENFPVRKHEKLEEKEKAKQHASRELEQQVEQATEQLHQQFLQLTMGDQ